MGVFLFTEADVPTPRPSGCRDCGGELPPAEGGSPRVYCSRRCRYHWERQQPGWKFRRAAGDSPAIELSAWAAKVGKTHDEAVEAATRLAERGLLVVLLTEKRELIAKPGQPKT